LSAILFQSLFIFLFLYIFQIQMGARNCHLVCEVKIRHVAFSLALSFLSSVAVNNLSINLRLILILALDFPRAASQEKQ